VPALVVGDTPLARSLSANEGTVPSVAIDCDGTYDGDLPVVRLLDAEPLGGRSSCGFFALPTGGAVELVRGTDLARRYFEGLGRPVVDIEDCVGGVIGRMVCQVINESCFAVQEGVGSPEDVDAGMELGMNHPRGPFAWLEAIGPAQVLRVLDGLRSFTGEERYRAAPWLRLKVARW
jgi:hypothetical protein